MNLVSFNFVFLGIWKFDLLFSVNVTSSLSETQTQSPLTGLYKSICGELMFPPPQYYQQIYWHLSRTRRNQIPTLYLVLLYLKRYIFMSHIHSYTKVKYFRSNSFNDSHTITSNAFIYTRAMRYRCVRVACRSTYTKKALGN